MEEWLGTDAYTIERELDRATGHTVCTARIESSPPGEIGLVAGDALHNLRSALDHTVYELAERHNGGPLPAAIQESLTFPVVGNQNRKGQRADGASIFQESVSRHGLREWLPDNVLDTSSRYSPITGRTMDSATTGSGASTISIESTNTAASTSPPHGSLPYVSSPGDPTVIEIQWRHPGNAPVSDGDLLLTFSGAGKGVDAHFERAVALDEEPIMGQEIGNLLEVLARQVEIYVACMTGEIRGPVWP